MVEFPPPKPPDCEQFSYGWPSGARIGLGVCFLTVGSWATFYLWEWGWVWGGSLLGIAVGGVLFFGGLADRKRKRILEAEVGRALAEWDDLVRAFGGARASGDNVVRLLQARGYREFDVRRWIMREIDGLVAQAVTNRTD